jgi:hypothetical protein
MINAQAALNLSPSTSSAATIVAISTATVIAISTATTTTTTTVFGNDNNDATALELVIVHCVDSSIGGGFVIKSNETESTASTGFAILDDDGIRNVSKLFEPSSEAHIVSVPTEGSDKKFGGHCVDCYLRKVEMEHWTQDLIRRGGLKIWALPRTGDGEKSISKKRTQR